MVVSEDGYIHMEGNNLREVNNKIAQMFRPKILGMKFLPGDSLRIAGDILIDLKKQNERILTNV